MTKHFATTRKSTITKLPGVVDASQTSIAINVNALPEKRLAIGEFEIVSRFQTTGLARHRHSFNNRALSGIRFPAENEDSVSGSPPLLRVPRYVSHGRDDLRRPVAIQSGDRECAELFVIRSLEQQFRLSEFGVPGVPLLGSQCRAHEFGGHFPYRVFPSPECGTDSNVGHRCFFRLTSKSTSPSLSQSAISTQSRNIRSTTICLEPMTPIFFLTGSSFAHFGVKAASAGISSLLNFGFQVVRSFSL